MGVVISSEGNVTTAFLDGEIDHHVAKSIREEIDAHALKTKPKLLKLDFGGVQFMDSSGIGLIMGRYKLACEIKGNLKVVNIPTRIEKMVKLLGLVKLGIFEEETK